jgi:hypothetical protein
MSYPSSRSWFGAGYFKLLTWLSPNHVSHGLPVWTPLSTQEQRALTYERLNEALVLLRSHVPQRYARVLRSLKGFLVLGTDSINASYDPANGVCRLGETFMAAPATTAAAIACTVVHEATHAWLFRLGIGYDSPIRHRVELLCIKASLLAAQRFPGAEAEVEHCRGQMSIDAEFFSNEKFVERSTNHLRELGCPEWIIRTLLWIRQKRAA